ncbi:MAG: hypothetical protein K8T91_00965 [Planctomycetes bacterium]|nr:hypothetical protein [Planctomycetota bacterium]
MKGVDTNGSFYSVGRRETGSRRRPNIYYKPCRVAKPQFLLSQVLGELVQQVADATLPIIWKRRLTTHFATA